MSTLTTPLQHSTGSLPSATWYEREIKGIGLKKKEIKLFLLIDNIIVSIEDPPNLAGQWGEQVLELISEFSKVAECKVNK